jgi:hypothetical protein
MITHAQWLRDTAKPKTRSNLLLSVDRALANYETGTGDLAALNTAFDAWKRSKKNWQKTDRYKQAMNNVVQQLHDELSRLSNAASMGQAVFRTPLAKADIAVALATQFTRKQNAAANAQFVTVDVSQTIHAWEWNAAGTQLVPQPGSDQVFQWSTRLQLSECAPLLTVTAIIRYQAKAGATGITPSKEQLDAWKRIICGAWNHALLTDNSTVPPKKLLIQFDIRWIQGWDSAAAGRSYKIACTNVQLAPLPPNADWRTRVARAQETISGSDVGTPNMEEWGVNDTQAIVHEFGHVIGNPDEYGVTVHNGQPVVSGIYDQPPFTTPSIMNDTRKAVIYPRHYDTAKGLYAQWKGINDNQVVVTV